MSSPMALPVDPSVDTTTELIYLFNVCTKVTATLLALSTVAVALRTWTRLKFIGRLGYDDSTMIAAQVCFIVTAALNLTAVHCEKVLLSEGRWILPLGPLVQVIRYSNAIYSLTMIIAKISIALFFLKLFATNFRWQRITVISLTVLSAVFGLAYLIFTIASCGIMVQSQKTTAMKTGTDWCPVQQIFVDFSITWSFINAFVDFVFAGMAIHLVCIAKMERSTKISAAILICLGGLGSAASCARVAVQLPLGDIRMAGVLLGIWSVVEAGTCIIAASLMTLRPLFRAAIDGTRSTLSSRGEASLVEPSYQSGHSRNSSMRSDTEKGHDDVEEGKMDGVVITKTWATESHERWTYLPRV